MTRHLTYPLITKVISIATRPADETPPNRVEIEVQTSLGRGVLHMSKDAASELGAKLATYLQADTSR
jgi:hypothetical protein